MRQMITQRIPHALKAVLQQTLRPSPNPSDPPRPLNQRPILNGMKKILNPLLILAPLQTAKPLAKAKIPHRIKRKVAEPIADVEFLVFPGHASERTNDLVHVRLDNGFLLHERVGREAVAQRPALARVLRVFGCVLHGGGAADLDGARVDGRLEHVLAALAEAVDVLVGGCGVVGEFVGGEAEYGACGVLVVCLEKMGVVGPYFSW